MSAEDGFLTRWSRRKVEARRAPPDQPPVEAPAAEGPPQPVEPAAPPFDLASLPSLESITAATDVSIFMRAGVPEALRNAALRRVWASDPAIRDYIGPSEYAWDFNTPGAIEGFGEIAPGTDMAKMVRDIMEGMPSVPVAEIEAEPAEIAEIAAESADLPALSAPDGEAGADEETALAQEPAAPLLQPRRRHGGATPR